jgi:hypothetical protein
VIVGKSIPEEGTSMCFGLVQSYDDKPKLRLFEVLKGQGMQLNQQITFFSDGGDTVRNLQLYLNPVLNGELEQTFRNWYPGFRAANDEKFKKVA